MPDNYDQLFKALAEPSRRRIVGFLCKAPCTAGDLGRRVGLAPNAVSFHLKELKEADLIDSKRDGRCIIYSINSDTLNRWQLHVNEAFTMTAHAPKPAAMSPSPFAPIKPTPAAPTPPPHIRRPMESSLPTELL